MSSRTIRVQNTSLGTVSASASSCNDFLKTLAASSTGGKNINFNDSEGTKIICLPLPASSSKSLVVNGDGSAEAKGNKQLLN